MTSDHFTSVFDAESILAHIDGQTMTVLSDAVSVDPIVTSDGGVAGGRPLHPARSRAGPGWVRTSVFSVRDPGVREVGLGLAALDGLDRVRDAGIADERAVPDGNAISIQNQRRKRAESYIISRN